MRAGCMSNAEHLQVDRCAHWQQDWGAGQTHCRACRKAASADARATLPPAKCKSGAVAVAGVLSFLHSVRKQLSPVVDCSGGNPLAGHFFLQAMQDNPSAWDDTCERPPLLRLPVRVFPSLELRRQRARHQPQVEGLVNAALSMCPRGGDGDHSRLQGACVVELGAGDAICN